MLMGYVGSSEQKHTAAWELKHHQPQPNLIGNNITLGRLMDKTQVINYQVKNRRHLIGCWFTMNSTPPNIALAEQVRTVNQAVNTKDGHEPTRMKL